MIGTSRSMMAASSGGLSDPGAVVLLCLPSLRTIESQDLRDRGLSALAIPNSVGCSQVYLPEDLLSYLEEGLYHLV